MPTAPAGAGSGTPPAGQSHQESPAAVFTSGIHVERPAPKLAQDFPKGGRPCDVERLQVGEEAMREHIDLPRRDEHVVLVCRRLPELLSLSVLEETSETHPDENVVPEYRAWSRPWQRHGHVPSRAPQWDAGTSWRRRRWYR